MGGRKRVSRQVRRCLIAAGTEPVKFSEIVEWAYAGGQRVWRWSIYRALKRYGKNVGYGLWVARAEDEDGG
jgi:hypothetical protein